MVGQAFDTAVKPWLRTPAPQIRVPGLSPDPTPNSRFLLMRTMGWSACLDPCSHMADLAGLEFQCPACCLRLRSGWYRHLGSEPANRSFHSVSASQINEIIISLKRKMSLLFKNKVKIFISIPVIMCYYLSGVRILNREKRKSGVLRCLFWAQWHPLQPRSDFLVR